ncbi:TPA: hypothetical protein ACH3X2_007834 [Trebouxia sp. C0005]
MATASRQHLLHALNFVCSSLHVLGVTGLTPETIRQAKFGGPVEAVFGRALHDLVVLSLAGFPESAHTLLQNFWSQIDYVPQRLKVPAEGRQLVSVYLQQHGYARASFCFADAHSGSRELLLAFAWVLVHTGAFQHVLKHTLCQHHITAALPPYPQDGQQSQQADRCAKQSGSLAMQYLQQVRQLCATTDGWAWAQLASDHAFMLLKKCQAKLRSLQSLHQSRCKLCHNVASLQRHLQQQSTHALSPYELDLLRNANKLMQHSDSLKEGACMVAQCREAQHHVDIFFHWLGDACKEDQPMNSESQSAEIDADAMCETAGATQHQLEVTSRELQPKLQATMQQTQKTILSGVSSMQEVRETPRLHALQQSIMSTPTQLSPGTCASGPALPSDIQAGVDAVRQSHQARELPWLGWQPTGRCIVHSQHADVLNDSRTGSLAVAESKRLTNAVLSVAKAMSKTRAVNMHSVRSMAHLAADTAGPGFKIRM